MMIFILVAQVVQVALVVRVEHVVQVAQVVQGDKTCHAMESKALRFFLKINRGFYHSPPNKQTRILM